MALWQLLPLEKVTGSDTYELAYAHFYDGEHDSPDIFWRPEHLYIPDEPEGIGCLEPYLSRVFPRFAGWYGDQRISLRQWAEVEKMALAEDPGDGRSPFFRHIRLWLQSGNRNADFFWWFGI